MKGNDETLFCVIENLKLAELISYAYQLFCEANGETYSQAGRSAFISQSLSEKTTLSKHATRLDAIKELKHDIIMYRWLWTNLIDEASRELFLMEVSRRLCGDPPPKRPDSFSDILQEMTYKLNPRVLLDCGGSGDGALSFANIFPEYDAIYYAEPDPVLYASGLQRLQQQKNVVVNRVGAFNHTASFELMNDQHANFAAMDDWINGKIDVIKLDSRGLELHAIVGLRRQIQQYTPVMFIHVANTLDAIWQIPYRIRILNPAYALFLRQTEQGLLLCAVAKKTPAPEACFGPVCPKLSVLTCAFNTPEYQIRTAIESVLHQTYRDFEYLIVDNGCTDGTRDIILEYANAYPQIKYVRLNKNSAKEAWDWLLSQAQGEFFAVLDSDDFYEPHFLQCMVEEQQHTGADFVCCGTKSELFDNPYMTGVRTYPDTVILRSDLGDCWPGVFAIFSSIWAKLYRTSQFRSLRPSQDAGTGNDTVLSLLYLKTCDKVALLENVLHTYLQVDQSASRRFVPQALEREKIILCENDSFLQSIDAWTRRNQAYNHSVFLAGVKRAVRYTVQAHQTAVRPRMDFLEKIANDELIHRSLLFVGQKETFTLYLLQSANALMAQTKKWENGEGFLWDLSQCPYFADPVHAINKHQMSRYIQGTFSPDNFFSLGWEQFHAIAQRYDQNFFAVIGDMTKSDMAYQKGILIAFVMGNVTHEDEENDFASLLIARKQALTGSKLLALLRLLSLVQKGGAYAGKAASDAALLLSEHPVLRAYADPVGLSPYRDIIAPMYENEFSKAQALLLERIKSCLDSPDVFLLLELLLTTSALNGDEKAFLLAKKLRIHALMLQHRTDTLEAGLEELNELCPTDRMTLYYTIQYLAKTGQGADAKSLSEAALTFYQSDPLFCLLDYADGKEIPPYAEMIL